MGEASAETGGAAATCSTKGGRVQGVNDAWRPGLAGEDLLPVAGVAGRNLNSAWLVPDADK